MADSNPYTSPAAVETTKKPAIPDRRDVLDWLGYLVALVLISPWAIVAALITVVILDLTILPGDHLPPERPGAVAWAAFGLAWCAWMIGPAWLVWRLTSLSWLTSTWRRWFSIGVIVVASAPGCLLAGAMVRATSIDVLQVERTGDSRQPLRFTSFQFFAVNALDYTTALLAFAAVSYLTWRRLFRTR